MVPVPVDDLDHHLGQVPGDRRAHRAAVGLGAGLVEHLEVGRADLVDEVGLHHRAAVGDAGGHHRHLQRRRRDVELPDRRECGLRLVGVGGEAALGLSGQVVEVAVAEAELLRLLAQGVVADSMPSQPNATLQETLSAWVSVTRLPPQSVPLSLGRLVSVCGRSSVAPPGTIDSGVYCPLESAAAAVTSLNVDPGGKTSWMPRFSIGRSSAALSRFQASVTAEPVRGSSFGSYVGDDTIARIAPVEGRARRRCP